MRDGSRVSNHVLRAALAGTLVLVACGGKGGGSDDPDGGGDDDGPDARRPPPGPPDAAFVCTPTDLGTVTFERIATWRDDAKGAYSMIHDDMCGPGLEGIQDLAVPALARRGLRAGLGPFVQACEEEGRWDVVRDAQAQGMEIISHSYTHPEIKPDNVAQEVVMAKQVFDDKLEQPVTFYIFPYDFYTTETINAVGSAGHLGARAGNRDDFNGADKPPINPATATDDLRLVYDVWPRNYSKYARFTASDMLWVHAVNAAEKGGWAIREFHSVIEDNDPDPTVRGFGPIKISDYEKHLDDLVVARAAGELWTDNPSTILKYRHARTACKAEVDGDKIVFDAGSADCKKFATPISVIVKVDDDLEGLTATQGDAPVPTFRLADGSYSVTADPTLGDVVLAGCGNASPGVEDVDVRARPTPAASVCDLEKVSGQGSDGQMDNLERPIEQFQVLPNPSQRDGRDGSWSWYPQLAGVQMVKEGSNTVLKYSGTNLAAWTGVTLAFLGGNGAGSCYDAGRYTGLEFRIKGRVNAPGDAALNGKVNVSLVTAETQTQNYGGDLVGEGGHFHKIVTLTPDWGDPVRIPFASFDKPTWGDTMSLTQLATGKLQAIDWGVSNMAQSFEIYIDDIKLY